MTLHQKKRVLLITRNFPPLTGGMERLNYHLYLELEKKFKLSIAGPEGCQNYLSQQTSFSLFPARPVGLFLISSLFTAYRLAVNEKPDLIIAGSGVTAIAAFIAAKRTGAKAIVFIHGLDILYPHPIYQSLFLPAIRACDGIFVNSSHTAVLARQKMISHHKINILNPGVTLPDKAELAFDPNEFKKSFSIESHKRILLSVGRLTERKGLIEFIQQCLPDIVCELPETLLVIIGNDATDALSQLASITAKIKETALCYKLQNHILLLGQVSEQLLKQAYVSSELLIFPVLDLPGDVEGFGMVAIEAAAHGLPTVAFAVGGVVDAVDQGKSGWLINSGDYKTLTQTITNFLKKARSEKAPKISSCQNFAKKFTWDKFGEKLTNIIQNI